MKKSGYGIIVATCFLTSLAFSYDYEAWENAIKNSDLAFFTRSSSEEQINQADLQGLLVLADEVIKQREGDIFNRKCRVFTSIGLKVLAPTVVAPLVGFIMDQRGLGAVLGISTLPCAIACTAAAADALSRDRQETLALTSTIFGIAATIVAMVGCAKLESWYWQQERCSCDKLEKALKDAVTIKTRLAVIAAKNR